MSNTQKIKMSEKNFNISLIKCDEIISEITKLKTDITNRQSQGMDNNIAFIQLSMLTDYLNRFKNKLKENKETFVSELQLEWNYLRDRISIIQGILIDETVSGSEKDILTIQFHTMATYLNILSIRLNNLKSNNTPV